MGLLVLMTTVVACIERWWVAGKGLGSVRSGQAGHREQQQLQACLHCRPCGPGV